MAHFCWFRNCQRTQIGFAIPATTCHPRAVPALTKVGAGIQGRRYRSSLVSRLRGNDGKLRAMQRFILIAVFSHLLASGGSAVCEEFAQPPVWSDEVKNVFFDDARKALSGPRPSATEQAEVAPTANAAKTTDVHWQELIDADTLTAEVKRIVNNLPTFTMNPARFKASTHNDCRRELTMLAALFKVIAEYPSDVRWKPNAPDMVRRCVSAAESCDEVSANSLATVEATHAMLEELLRGQTPRTSDIDSDGESANCPAFAPLMQRMELTTEETLPVQLAKEREFRKNSQSIAEEAQMLAMLSEVIRDEAYGYADDETYQGHADELRDAAGRLRSAATEQDFAKAVEAAAGVSQSCANCHADYRG